MSIGDYSNIIMQGKRDSIANAGRIGSGVAAMGKQFGQWNTNRQIKDELSKGGSGAVPASNESPAVMGSAPLSAELSEQGNQLFGKPAAAAPGTTMRVSVMGAGREDSLGEAPPSPATKSTPVPEPAAVTPTNPTTPAGGIDWNKIEELVRQGEAKGYKTMFSSAELERRKELAANAKQQEQMLNFKTTQAVNDAIAKQQAAEENKKDKEMSEALTTYKEYQKEYGSLAGSLDRIDEIIEKKGLKDGMQEINAMKGSLVSNITRAMSGKNVNQTEFNNVLRQLLSEKDLKEYNLQLDNIQNADRKEVIAQINAVLNNPTSILSNPGRVAALAAKANLIGLDNIEVQGALDNALNSMINNTDLEKIVRAGGTLLPQDYYSVASAAAQKRKDTPRDYSRYKTFIGGLD